MLKEIKEKMPVWCEDIDTKYQLMMSDDIDSLMCYIMQNLNYGRECEYFVNTSKDRAYKSYDGSVNKKGKQYFYLTENATNKGKDIIALDFSINANMKAWDNHVVNITSGDKGNEYSANMNIGINSNNYTKKFCISSFITMLSYYDVDIEKWTHEELIALCGIDGLYQPFKNTRFTQQGKENLHKLGYDFLSDFINKNLQEIEEFDKKYYSKKTIWVNKDGYLETNLNLDRLSEIWGCKIALPNKKFELKKTLETEIFNANKSKEQLEKEKGKKIFNIALTYKNSGVISYV